MICIAIIGVLLIGFTIWQYLMYRALAEEPVEPE